ncbi:MAG: 4-alpha-glucanotransferase [Chromatiaceae bacterium]|nr:4-alpha-glucanotransferase [Gammaproteobacteria bacterium]MCP5304238.1 4-alpha-glucanotransferase [Chromatiaceae bacterium]MCP5313963.1 4-alpha-glucanotransferase [Chromatiaceae bacterium]
MSDSVSTRRAGVLLHPTSLPSGKIDDDCLRWLDFMADSGLSVWQVLPLVIPDPHGSPYQSCSAFAMNPQLLPRHDAPINQSEFETFCAKQAHWLDDFALFEILKRRFAQQSWVNWAPEYRNRDAAILRQLRVDTSIEIASIKQEQYRLDRAWQRVCDHAHARDISLFGDIPLFIAHDSADTWAQPQDFLLDESGNPTYVTGVPPDYFAELGQRWGNPHYRWDRLEADGFDWWINRMRRQFELFDLVRIDHFRGLVAVWMIDAACETAVDGFWQETPGDALLTTLSETFHALPIVAEDLGTITEEVRELRRKFRLPGMAVLQFAFDHFSDNPHKPANITVDNIAYTGTHDNDTCVGWFNGLEPHQKAFVFEVLGIAPTDDIAGLLVRTAMASNAAVAVAPLQDYLGLGSEARMNTPGTAEGNWRWQFAWTMLGADVAPRIRSTVEDSGRLYAH